MRNLGLTTVFGNPGSTEETFLKEFPADFRYILALHESSAVAAADGFSQLTRAPALVNLHTAAGLGNAMGTVVTAALNHTPLIITAGNQTREMLLLEPWLTNVSPEELPRPWVKWSYQPVRPEDVPAALMRAYAIALQPPAGPVFLSLPLDDWEKPATGTAQVRTVSSRFAPDPDRLAELATAIEAASKPILVYGSGIARGAGWPSAIRLAETLGAPVWAAPASERTPFPEDHPLYRGVLPFATGPLAETMEGHDLAVVIGAPVFRYYPYVPGPYLPQGMTRLVHITDDPAEAGRAPVGDSLLADPVLALDGLITLLVGTPGRPVGTATTPDDDAEDSPDGDGTGDPLTARQALDALRAASPANTVLVAESPSNLADLHEAWPVTTEDAFFTFASGGLGWGLPASVGIALAERDSGRSRPVVAVIGDGSMQYSVQGLWTAAHHQLPVVFVVLNNSEYAILKSFAALEQTPGVPGLDLPGIDVASLGRGYGCHSETAATAPAIAAAMAAALVRGGPTVLNVPIAADVPPLL